ncbi:hypothetical protein [Streptomyces minutiscleroticus]|nr:hypothetical protein [Streptomyces minutiscleroticus]
MTLVTVLRGARIPVDQIGAALRMPTVLPAEYAVLASSMWPICAALVIER